MAKMLKVEKTEAFISKLYETPCLWDAKSASYKDRNEKDKAYKVLSETFQMTGNNIRTIA